MTLWNITEQNSDCAGWPYHVLEVFDDKTIVYQRAWLKFPQPIKHLLFHFPYKNCKHTCSLVSIDVIAQSTNCLITSRILSWLHFFKLKYQYIFSWELFIKFTLTFFFSPKVCIKFSLATIFWWKKTRNICWGRGRNTWWE